MPGKVQAVLQGACRYQPYGLYPLPLRLLNLEPNSL